MSPLLTTTHRLVLEQLAHARVLLAFDFDGTLAPIVERHADAGMRATTSKLFHAVCQRYPCAVISGRSQRDVRERLEGAAVKYVVGNHGLEPGRRLPDFEREVSGAHERLGPIFRRLPGVELEDKQYSLAVHYRRARHKRKARVAILEAITKLPEPMRVIPGKQVVNVLPARAPHKGDALLALRDRAHADTALYVGDDVTDEDVFTLDQPGRLVTVRVGKSRASAAMYSLRDQREIDRLLARLVALREKPARS